MTRIPLPPYLSPEWHSQRKHDQNGKTRFGASDAPVLMGCSKYRNIVDLFISRTTETEPEPPNDAQMRGHRLEPALLAYAGELLGQPVATPDEWFTTGRFVATLDGLTADESVVVECKTTTAYSSDDDIPLPFYWQVQAQLACVPEAQYALVVVLDKWMQFGSWRVERNEQDIAELLWVAEEVGDSFDKGELPPDSVLREEQVRALYQNPEGIVELTSEQFDIVCQLAQTSARRKTIETEEQALRDQVATFLASTEVATFDGKTVVSYKTRKGGTRLDTKSLSAEHPDLVEKYQRVSPPTRVMRFH